MILPKNHEEKELFYLLGIAISAWSEVEFSLFVLLDRCLMSDRFLSYHVFWASRSYDVQFKMVSACVEEKVESTEGREEWKKVQKEFRSQRENRNSIAHSKIMTIEFARDGEINRTTFLAPGGTKWMTGFGAEDNQLVADEAGNLIPAPANRMFQNDLLEVIRSFVSLSDQITDFFTKWVDTQKKARA